MYWKLAINSELVAVSELKTEAVLSDYLIYVSELVNGIEVFHLFATSGDPENRISEWERKSKAHGIKVYMIILMDNGQNFVSKYRTKIGKNIDEYLELHKKYIIGGYKIIGKPISDFLPPSVPIGTSASKGTSVPSFPTKPSPKPKVLPTSGTIYVLIDNAWKEATIIKEETKNVYQLQVGTTQVTKTLRITYYRKDWYL